LTESAAGLFRATGKRKKARPVMLLDGTFEMSDETERKAEDFYPTPGEPVRAYLKAELPRLLELGGEVWENAAGDGAIVRELEAVGLKVYASDLIDRGCPGVDVRDFYAFRDWPTKTNAGKVTVGNPPYDQINWKHGKGRWLTHCRKILGAQYCAFYLSWSWPGAAGIGTVWDDDPPARVYLTRWKVDFTGDGSPPMLNAWFVWDGETELGETRLLMLDRYADARQGELL
jgi:hypothetical protein